MAPNTLECLACGERRSPIGNGHMHLTTGECPRCGYLGWTYSDELDSVPAERSASARSTGGACFAEPPNQPAVHLLPAAILVRIRARVCGEIAPS